MWIKGLVARYFADLRSYLPGEVERALCIWGKAIWQNKLGAQARAIGEAHFTGARNSADLAISTDFADAVIKKIGYVDSTLRTGGQPDRVVERGRSSRLRSIFFVAASNAQ